MCIVWKRPWLKPAPLYRRLLLLLCSLVTQSILHKEGPVSVQTCPAIRDPHPLCWLCRGYLWFMALSCLTASCPVTRASGTWRTSTCSSALCQVGPTTTLTVLHLFTFAFDSDSIEVTRNDRRERRDAMQQKSWAGLQPGTLQHCYYMFFVELQLGFQSPQMWWFAFLCVFVGVFFSLWQ